MKIIKKVGFILVIVLLIVIYITNKDTKVYYVSLGDGISRGINENDIEGYGYSDYVKDYLNKINKLEFYTKKFSGIDYRTTDIINNIEDNIEIIQNNKKITIKKSLMNADVITLSTGLNEILYKINKDNLVYVPYDYIDEVLNDIKKLINIIKKYCKEDIIFIGYYNPFINDSKMDSIIKYANNKLIDICVNEDIYYIDTYNLFKNNNKVFTNINSYYPNIDGYKLISEKTIQIIQKNIIKSKKTM